MIDTSHDSERQAGLSSDNLVRVGLSSLVHSFRLSAEHLTCLPRFLPPSRVPCSTVLVRLLWREVWPNHASFVLFTVPNRFSCFPARAFIPLCTNSFVLRSLSQLLTSSSHSRRVGWTGREFCTILFLWRSLHLYCSRSYLV